MLRQCYRPVTTVWRYDCELAGTAARAGDLRPPCRGGASAARLARFRRPVRLAIPVLSGRVAAGKFTAVVTKSALILPCLAVLAGLAVASQAIGISRRTS